MCNLFLQSPFLSFLYFLLLFFFWVPNNLETLFTMKSNLSKKIDNKQHSNDEHPAESGKEIQNFQMKREKNVNVACADASQSEVRLHYIIVFFFFLFFTLECFYTLRFTWNLSSVMSLPDKIFFSGKCEYIFMKWW